MFTEYLLCIKLGLSAYTLRYGSLSHWLVKAESQGWTQSCCCAVLSCSVVSDSLWPHGLQPARLLCPWGFSRQEYWSGLPCPLPGDRPNPGMEPRSPALQVDFLPSEPPGKLKNTGVGSPSLLQRNFLTQESNRGLLHCRRILYQFSYPGSPNPELPDNKTQSVYYTTGSRPKQNSSEILREKWT